MLRGPADILDDGPEHDRAQALLVRRYPQYRTMNLAGLPVIALRIARVSHWGDLARGVDGPSRHELPRTLEKTLRNAVQNVMCACY